MQLSDIRLRSLLRYAPESKKLSPISTIKYFRMPEDREYPLNLSENYEKFSHRNDEYPGHFGTVEYYFMKIDKLSFIRQDYDFYACRRLLNMLIIAAPTTAYTREISLEAFRLKGCIYLRMFVPSVTACERMSYSYMARQLLFSDEPGKVPDTDARVDSRDQTYGIFSAQLGRFRLLYSAEVTGVTNTEKLGDLTDPEQLEECSLTNVRVIFKGIHWRRNYRLQSWLVQSYLCGSKQMAVASIDNNGVVDMKIEIVTIDEMIKSVFHDLQPKIHQLYGFLEQINTKMDEIDNPSVSLKFTLFGNVLRFDEAFDRDFVDFANQF